MLYADPGSGILIWQMLLALFIGATFYFSKIRSWVVAKLRPVRRDNVAESETITPTSVSQGK